MATVFCPSCGTPAPRGVPFCGKCGASIPAIALGTTAPSLGWPPYAPAPSFPMPALSDTRAVERAATHGLRIAVILNLLGVLLSLVVPQVVGAFLGGANPFSAAVPFGPAALVTHWIYLTGALVATGFFVGAVSWWWVRRGFRSMDGVDRAFGTPATLVTLGLVGLVLLGLAFFAFLGEVGSLVQCTPPISSNSTVPPGCLGPAVGAILLTAGLLFVGAIIALVGLIGYILGMWRFGERYHETLIQAGAIMTIFPFLNVIGYILLLVGLSNVDGKIASRPS
ncbi:MAG: DUF973 family protein [Thermoplasmata archaeon]